jgi:hypothetical protein
MKTMIKEVINMARHKNFSIYAGLTIFALALSIGIFSWISGVHPGLLSAPGCTSNINRCV